MIMSDTEPIAGTSRRATSRHMVIHSHMPTANGIDLTLAEQRFVLLFGTYRSWLLVPGAQAPGDTTNQGTIFALNALTLTNVAADVFRQTHWIPVCGRLSLAGFNVSSPAAEGGERKIIWVKSHTPGQMITLRRTSNRIVARHGSNSLRATISTTPLSSVAVARNLPDIRPGTVGHITVDMRDNGRPHELPFARFPRLGGFADWEDLIKLGARMEWKISTGQWLATHLQMAKAGDLYKGNPSEIYYAVFNVECQPLWFGTPEHFRATHSI